MKQWIRTSTVFVCLVLVIGVLVIDKGFAWTNPAGAPPIANPAITTSGGNVGIGTATPGSKLSFGTNYDTAGTNPTYHIRLWENGASAYGFGVQNSKLVINANQVGGNIVFNAGSTNDAPTERMRITNAGIVGIGTASPDSNYKLTTAGGGVKAENSSATQPAGYFNNAGGGPAITIGTGGLTLGGVNKTTWPGDVNWTVSGTNIYNSNTGNVGIGTTAPEVKLDVAGSVQSSGQGRFKGWYNTGTGAATEIGISGNEAYLLGYNRSTAAYLPVNIQAGTTILRFPVSGMTTLTNGLAVTSGNVGIGVPNPLVKLAVPTSASIGFKDATYEGTIEFYNSANGNMTLKTTFGTGDINLIPGSTGNVGIGTATPGAKLEVAGTIKIADGSQGAGKVLTSDASGLATWATPTAIPCTYAGKTYTAYAICQLDSTSEQMCYPDGHWSLSASSGGKPPCGESSPTYAP